MLRFILGRAGSGKTHYIRNTLANLALNGVNDIILIIPEQFSFESEKAMLELLGESKAQKVEILSFSRLADSVFREYGGVSGETIGDGGKAVLMSLALESVSDKLTLYRKHSKNTAVIADFLNLRREFKKGSVTTDMLMAASEGMEKSLLKAKTEEMSLVFAAYDALLKLNFLDEDDVLTRMCDTLDTHNFFAGKTVAIDSFKGFTAQEMRVIEKIIAQSDDCYISLCCDTLNDDKNGAGTFSLIQRTSMKIREIAKKSGKKIAVPVVLSEGKRFKDEALSALEKGIYEPSSLSYSGDGKNICVCRCRDIHDECDYVACEIKRLMREENFRCRDIAVVARDINLYKAELQGAFERYSVPFYRDDRKPISSQPLVALVRNILDCANSSFSTSSIINVLKTGLAGFSPSETGELENYVLMWSISGKRWLYDFTQNPFGLTEDTTDKSEKELEKINSLRKRIAVPVGKFAEQAKKGGGENISKAIYDFLMKIKAGEHLKEYAKELEADGETALAAEQGRIWDMLMGVLNECAVTMGENPVTLKRYSELFEIMLASCDMGSLPQGLDVVNAGSADRIRMDSPRAVFVMGACDGVFPLQITSSGLLTDADRRVLLNLGMEISEPGEYKAVDEQFLAYNTVCSAREKLYVTCADKLSDGTAASQSSIITEIQRIVPNCIKTDTSLRNEIEKIESVRSAFELYPDAFKKQDEFSQTLKEFLSQRDEYSQKLKGVKRAVENKPAEFENPEISKKLFGENMYFSASAIESFYSCRFKYFCQRGLRLSEDKKAELDPMSRGTVIHYVLENLLKKYPGKALSELSEKEREEEVTKLLEEYLSMHMGGEEEKTSRFLFLYRQLKRVLVSVVERIAEEYLVCKFMPVDFELKMDKDGDIPPYELKLKDGGKIVIRGSVDRVDLMEENGVSYIRVVDYKSGGKKFALSDVLQGLNMQMLIYLMNIAKNGSERYGEIVPSGVLYMSAALPSESAASRDDEKALEEKRDSVYRMNGIVLRDMKVIQGMEENMAGRFIDVKYNSKNELTGTLITLEEMGKLFNKMDKIIEDMAEYLHEGKVEALPSEGANYKNICQWCSYSYVCGREKDSPVRNLAKFSNDDALKELRKEAKEDEQKLD